jgi:hypothetical protein
MAIVVLTLNGRQRRSRNILFAAFALLVIIWTIKLFFPQHTVLSVYSSHNPPFRQYSPSRRHQHDKQLESSRHNRDSIPPKSHPPHPAFQHRPWSHMAHPHLHIHRIRRTILGIRRSLSIPTRRRDPNPDPARKRALHELGFGELFHDETVAMGEFGACRTYSYFSER